MNTNRTNTSDRADILRAKHRYGFWFGAVLGLGFACFSWGVDAYLLSGMNSFYPWVKFAGGALPCMVVGGATGWLAAKIEKPIVAALLWVAAASLFAWLIVALPLRIAPLLLGNFDADLRGLLHYTDYGNFSGRVYVAYGWIIIFVSLTGLLQIPLSTPAVFSTSALGKIAPMLVGLALMGICGTIMDGMNNELLRSPIHSTNLTIQFWLDHQGGDMDPLEARRMHVGALRVVEDVITPERKLLVSGHDEFLEDVQVLVRFEDAWVECHVLFNQLITCRQVK